METEEKYSGVLVFSSMYDLLEKVTNIKEISDKIREENEALLDEYGIEHQRLPCFGLLVEVGEESRGNYGKIKDILECRSDSLSEKIKDYGVAVVGDLDDITECIDNRQKTD